MKHLNKLAQIYKQLARIFNPCFHLNDMHYQTTKSIFLFCLFSIMLLSCKVDVKTEVIPPKEKSQTPYVFVLGTAQDAGYPQANCEKECCQRVYENQELEIYTSCIAVVDPISKEQWIFDATPNFREQLKLLNNETGLEGDLPTGIFLTHAHIGHYTGLMHLGREVIGAKEVPVYAMPKMKFFLETNGPWSQLVTLNNIALEELAADKKVQLNERIAVTPFLVPHRDEYSETVGYRIDLNSKSFVFIPDINKWEVWDRSIVDLIKEVDYALLDATFYADGEIPGRAMSEIPHPFVQESMELFQELSAEDKSKVYFIHMNHTNPLLIEGSEAQREVATKGFFLARQGLILQ